MKERSNVGKGWSVKGQRMEDRTEKQLLSLGCCCWQSGAMTQGHAKGRRERPRGRLAPDSRPAPAVRFFLFPFACPCSTFIPLLLQSRAVSAIDRRHQTEILHSSVALTQTSRKLYHPSILTSFSARSRNLLNFLLIPFSPLPFTCP
jgi:hypothetical protein